MHYALCKNCSLLPRPEFVPHETPCIMRFMHCDRMHYDQLDCIIELWRLEDISVGAFGFTVELYFLSLRQILSTSIFRPREIHVLFYTSAFKIITSDWEQFKGLRGTLQIILNLVCDIAVQDRGIFSTCEYPSYITEELLKLLDNMVKGQASSYIDAAMEELRDLEWRAGDRG